MGCFFGSVVGQEVAQESAVSLLGGVGGYKEECHLSEGLW